MGWRTGWRQAARWPRFDPYRVLKYILVFVMLVQIARLLWVLVTPVSPLGDWRAPLARILPADARAALFSSFDPFNRGAAGATPDATAVTSLDLTLYGVRVNEASGQGSAIIAGSDGVQSSYAVGEEVAPGVTLAEVAFDYVVLSRSGVRENLFLDQSVPAETVGVGPVVPSAAASAAVAPAPAQAITPEAVTAGIGFAPRTENGRITGFAVASKGDGSLFSSTGFRAGDIVTQINGRAVSSARDIADLTQQLKPGARVSLMVERGADVVPIAIIIPES